MSNEDAAVDTGDTKKCPYCAETIKAEAVVCRFCNRDLNSPAPEIKAPVTPPKVATSPASRTNSYCLAGCIILLLPVIIGTCAMFGSGGSSSSTSGSSSSSATPGKDYGTTIDANVMAESFVKKQLKAPGTATFSPVDETTITSLGSGKYRVVGYVDAENSFGAHIRNRYDVTLHKDPASDNWRLDDIHLTE